MKKPGAISEARKLPYSKVLVQKHNEPAALRLVKEWLPPHSYPEFLAWLWASPQVAKGVVPAPFPRTQEEWNFSLSISPTIPPRNELLWASAYFMPHAEMLKEFVARKESLDSAFLRGTRDDCFRLLDSVEHDWGLSFWLIKKRLALLQYFDGLEAQKAYAKGLKEYSPERPAIRYITHFVSYRSESAVTPGRFREEYSGALLKTALPHPVPAYLRYALLSEYPRDAEAICWILQQEADSALIDYYEAYVRMVALAVQDRNRVVAAAATSGCSALRNRLSDPRLSRIIFQYDGVQSRDLDASTIDAEVTNEFLGGNYAAGLSKAMADLSSNPSNAGTIYLASLCSSVPTPQEPAPDSPPYKQLISLMSGMVADGPESTEARTNLDRFSWLLDGGPCGAMVRVAIKTESISDVLPGNHPDVVRTLPSLCSLHPVQALWAYKPAAGPSLTQIAAENASGALTLSRDAKLWATMTPLLIGGQYAEALPLASDLLKSELPFFRRLAMRAVPICLLKTDRHEDCVTALTDWFITNPHLVDILPVMEVVTGTNAAIRQGLAGNLSWAICCDIHASQIGAEGQHLRRVIYDDYVAAKGVQRVSELTPPEKPEELRKHIYFLREICVENVMDTSIVFDSSSDVANERVAICQLLAKLDPPNAERFQSESRGILQRLTVRKRFREIEHSKIYVDIEGLKAAARNDLKEDYARYQTFLAKGLSSEDQAYFNTIKQKREKGDISALFSMDVPRNERTALLDSMVLRLRDEFVSNTEHGLDGYLSVRIRHGTLAGQLRSPLESEFLLTPKDLKTGQHLPNTEWMNRLGLEAGDEANALNGAFR